MYEFENQRTGDLSKKLTATQCHAGTFVKTIVTKTLEDIYRLKSRPLHGQLATPGGESISQHQVVGTQLVRINSRRFNVSATVPYSREIGRHGAPTSVGAPPLYQDWARYLSRARRLIKRPTPRRPADSTASETTAAPVCAKFRPAGVGAEATIVPGFSAAAFSTCTTTGADGFGVADVSSVHGTEDLPGLAGVNSVQSTACFF